MVTRTIRRDATHGLRHFYRDFAVFIQHVYGSLWRWKHWSAGFWAHFNIVTYLLTYLPSVKDNERRVLRRRQRRFQLSSVTTLHIRSSKQKHSSANSSYCAWRRMSTPRIAFANKTQEGNVKCPSSTREDKNSQRPTQVQALSDD